MNVSRHNLLVIPTTIDFTAQDSKSKIIKNQDSKDIKNSSGADMNKVTMKEESLEQEDSTEKGMVTKKKVKMFRCELCDVRKPLDSGPETHTNSQAHLHMKEFFDHGLWPGVLPEAISSSKTVPIMVSPKPYIFGEKGNILCVACGVLVEDASVLLQHQMQSCHIVAMQTKGFFDIVPRLLYCEVCNVIVGTSVGKYGALVYQQHLSSGAHLIEAATRKVGNLPTKVSVSSTETATVETVVIAPAKEEPTLNTPIVSSKSDIRCPDVSELRCFEMRALVNVLGKKFMVTHKLVPENCEQNDMPWTNDAILRLYKKMDEVAREVPTDDRAIRRKKEHRKALEKRLSKERFNAKWKYIQETSQQVRNLLWELKSNKEKENEKNKPPIAAANQQVRNLLWELKSNQKKEKEKEKNKPPIAAANQPTDVRIKNTAMQLKKNVAEMVVGSPAVLPEIAKYSAEPAEKRSQKFYKPESPTVDPFLGREFSSSRAKTPEQAGIFEVEETESVLKSQTELSTLLDALTEPKNSDSSMVQLLANVLTPKPSSESTFDQLLGVLIEQETRRAGSGMFDPQQQLRAAILNQLVGQRQRSRSTVDIVGELLRSVLEKKEKEIVKSPEENLESLLDTILREDGKSTEDASSPRMSWVWDGQTPAEREYIPAVYVPPETSAFSGWQPSQKEAEEVALRERVESAIRGVLGGEQKWENVLGDSFQNKSSSGLGGRSEEIFSNFRRSESRSRSRSPRRYHYSPSRPDSRRSPRRSRSSDRDFEGRRNEKDYSGYRSEYLDSYNPIPNRGLNYGNETYEKYIQNDYSDRHRSERSGTPPPNADWLYEQSYLADNQVRKQRDEQNWLFEQSYF